jgi:hypothetical protein
MKIQRLGFMKAKNVIQKMTGERGFSLNNNDAYKPHALYWMYAKPYTTSKAGLIAL